jgi:propanediol utilization protein
MLRAEHEMRWPFRVACSVLMVPGGVVIAAAAVLTLAAVVIAAAGVVALAPAAALAWKVTRG